MTHRPVHLVGSVNLADAESVFRTACTELGAHLTRVPDGETGERSIWTDWQFKLFEDHPLFEPGPDLEYGTYLGLPTRKLRSPATRSDDIELDPPGYAAAALESYAVFARLKEEGVIGTDVRFQLSLPTPWAVLSYVWVPDHPRVEPAYERRLLDELDIVCAAIPHDQLAVQWDVCQEMVALEGMMPTHFDDVLGGHSDRLARLGDHVPTGVELGYHFCYGSWHEEHFVEPSDTGLIVDLASATVAKLGRSVQFLHLPVPIERDDSDYFRPLERLVLSPETTLFLGLVHLSDGVDGARRRIAAAERFVSGFGVAAECGLGRGEPETMVARLQMQAAVARA